ncbi:hypothetical protein T459_07598 [Capsicum annuum]|uniref:Uncharacterized protein n=1 Tax=Capsicum annuum TaxID=4072 RepID=A0A2G2ZU50_CAPAN|nr:hypothetical protein T459_07598 [Capsicum annuum]
MIEQQKKEELYYEEWIPLLPRVHCHKNPSVPQIVATAIGICAEFGAYFLKLHTTVIFRHLKTLMEHPDAKNLDNIMAYEAAVSTCGKLNQFVVKAATTMRFNLDEAKISHKMLCSMMEMSEEKVIGPGGSYIPITIFWLRRKCGLSNRNGNAIRKALGPPYNARGYCLLSSVMWACNPNGDINAVECWAVPDGLMRWNAGLSQMVGHDGLVFGLPYPSMESDA